MTEYVNLYRNKYVMKSPEGIEKRYLPEDFIQVYEERGGAMVPMICEMEARRRSIAGEA